MSFEQLIVVEEQPYNAETPLGALDQSITPGNLFYVRNHFDMPRLDPAHWRLRVDGLVEKALDLRLADLQTMPEASLAATLECAGNGRAAIRPPVGGAPWSYGAVSSAEFRGTALREVLDRAGIAAEAVELRCTGADRGEVAPGRDEAFVRGLPVAVARDPDTLLAWDMNGGPLTLEHGSPLRLVVPRWYGMASVKWLTEITVLGTTFDGYFQRERYVYTGSPTGEDSVPVTRIRVRSVIAFPRSGDYLKIGPIEIRGMAWSGAGPIAGVDVTVDGGRTWARAGVRPPPGPYLPATWRHMWHPVSTGQYRLAARASDAAGNTQPEAPAWNRYGYGNNALQWIDVTVR